MICAVAWGYVAVAFMLPALTVAHSSDLHLS
jgi:hypothetical protein